MANTYTIGQVVRLRANFQNATPTDVDPGTIQLKVKDPLGSVSTYVYGTDAEVIKDSAGNYHCDVEPAAQGVWKYRWEGLNSNKAAKENSFAVEESSFD
jgi:hypothetical protein